MLKHAEYRFHKTYLSSGLGGRGYLVLVSYHSLRLKYRSIRPPTNYFSLLNKDEIVYSF